MRNRRWLIWLTAIALAVAAVFVWPRRSTTPKTRERTTPIAAGRAGDTGARPAGFRLAVAGRPLVFPRDHASHPEYATEWWYYTGHLRDDAGNRYGYQLTFFRVGVTPPSVKRASEWAVRNIYFAHLAVTDETHGTYAFRQRISRGVLGEAGADTGAYHVHIGDWSVRLDGKTHVFRALKDGIGVDLRATPTKPPALNGSAGLSQKAEGLGRASYYYSLTRMTTSGTVTVDGKTHRVTGESWFDHEFGSNVLAAGQVGWDWFSLQMDNDTEAMLYHMRLKDGGIDPYSSGTFVGPQGNATHMGVNDYTIEVLDHWKSRATGAEYPSRWRVRIPSRGWDVEITPTVSDQEIHAEGPAGVTYWEGSVKVAGTAGGRAVFGRGYVELTGYANPFQQAF